MTYFYGIQIQHLLKLNNGREPEGPQFFYIQIQHLLKLNNLACRSCSANSVIQIQHLLKLNARKINPYGFYYTIKSINGQGF